MSSFNNNKVCCIADVHIGVHQNAQSWHNIAIEWARWLAADLEKRNVTDIVISGDFFHYRSEVAVNTLHVASDILDIWERFNIKILVGNHDAFFKNNSSVNSLAVFRRRRNVTIIDEITTIKFADKDIVFCPWGTSPEQIPQCDIIFGHFSIESFKEAIHFTCEHGVRSKDLLSKASLVVSGHFHIRQERQYKNGTILYTGNPYEMNFGDTTDQKGYYILDLITHKYDFTPNNISPKHFKVKLSELVAEGSITDNVRTLISNNIIKLIIDRYITSREIDILLNKLSQLRPMSIILDYEINYSAYQINTDDSSDLSNVNIEHALDEFINLLDISATEKRDVRQYSRELFEKFKV